MTAHNHKGPECPYCGYVEEDAYEFCPGELEWSTEVDCSHCEKTYSCSCTCEFTYRSEEKSSDNI